MIGTGAVGIEFAQIYARFGAHVTALEALPHVLPQEDEEAAASILPALEADGIAMRSGVRIEGARHDGTAWTLAIEGGAPDQRGEGRVQGPGSTCDGGRRR